MSGDTPLPRGRSGGAPRRHHFTLRTRLVAVLVACLLLSCAAVALATTLALRRYLLERLDQQLTAAGIRYATSLELPGDRDSDDAAFRFVVGQPAGTLGARVVSGTVTAFGVVGQPASTGSATTRAKLARFAASASARTVGLDDLGEYRLLVSAGPDGDLLVTGLPEHSVDETIRNLLEVEAIVFASTLVLSALAEGIFVRMALRPLNRVAGTALQVSGLPLGSGSVSLPDRVNNPAPGTEVGQVAEAFNHMLEHVESALTERQATADQMRRFVADASHELRTPVAVIRSHAEFAQRVDQRAGVEAVHALERIVAESERMSRLVDDLLLLARLESGRPLDRAAVDVSRLALDAVRDAQVAGADHSWQLDLPAEPVLVTGDEHSLHQVIANLLANAREHTPPGTTVTVAVASVRDIVTVEVRDNGPGIASQLQPRVFERLVHGDRARHGSGGGSGLGLSIVAAIVAAHAGRISLQSTPGSTVFRIELPAFSSN